MANEIIGDGRTESVRVLLPGVSLNPSPAPRGRRRRKGALLRGIAGACAEDPLCVGFLDALPYGGPAGISAKAHAGRSSVSGSASDG
jgi:hypothetical protein